jgi:hypothetical protein
MLRLRKKNWRSKHPLEVYAKEREPHSYEGHDGK